MLRKVWLLKWFSLYVLCLGTCLYIILSKIAQLQLNNDLAGVNTEITFTDKIAQTKAQQELPGDFGRPYRLDETALSPVEKVKYTEGWKNYEFNQYVSDLISIQRNLEDIRDPL